MIRVALIDDHPALVAGLMTVLRSEPGIIPVGTASDAQEAESLLYRTTPDLVLLDYHLPRTDGLQLCQRIKRNVPSPKVLIYSAYADAWLGFAARAAGADGVASKGAPARELFELIRRVARGEDVLPPVSGEHMNEAASRLDGEDLPLLSMLIDGTPPHEIADTLRIDPQAMTGRIDRVLGRLRVDVPSPMS
jgi:DNA-binding NarL/FixJ family response regulator